MSKTSKKRSGNVMLPGAHRQLHQRAQGWAIYWYAWRGGPQIARFAGATLEETEAAELEGAHEIAAGYAAERQPKAAVGLIARVVDDYRAHPAYTDLRTATKATYRVWLDRITEEFGALSEREVTDERVSAWLQKVYAKHGARARDHALRILSRLASWGRHKERKLFSAEFKPAEGFERLYRAPAQSGWEAAAIKQIPQVMHGTSARLMCICFVGCSSHAANGLGQVAIPQTSVETTTARRTQRLPWRTAGTPRNVRQCGAGANGRGSFSDDPRAPTPSAGRARFTAAGVGDGRGITGPYRRSRLGEHRRQR